VLIVLLSLLFALHKNAEIQTGIWIERPTAAVWQILTGTNEYPVWNPPIEIGKKSIVATEAHTSKGIVLVLSCAAQFMVVLDIAIVNVALPSIQQDLGIGQSTLQWIVIAYGLILGGFLLLGGTIGNIRAVSRLA
jgi:hypothetical protein